MEKKHSNKENIDKILKDLGITYQEIEIAGGKDVLDQILWSCERTNDFSLQNIEATIQKAIQQKIEGKELDISLQNMSENDERKEDISEKQDVLSDVTKHFNNVLKPNFNPYQSNISLDYSNKTIKEIYENEWGEKPHLSLKLLVEAFFCDVQEMMVEKEDIKSILHSIQLLRSCVGGMPLPHDAYEEKLIVYARNMYREFIQTKNVYNDNPMQFLFDNFYKDIPEKHLNYVKKLPHVAIIKIFAETCLIDPQTREVEEPLPEEIDLNSVIELIEILAKIYKIWQ